MQQQYDETDKLLDHALDILAQLIAFDTTSRGSNLALIQWTEDYLASHGVKSNRVTSKDGEKANLYATIGPMTEGGIILSGHSDVVPIDGQNWSSDPWALTARTVDGEDRLFGRGTCDMKGFIALALAGVPHFSQGQKPVHLAISYDEEIGCTGAPPMIKELAQKLPAPRLAIVGEPSSMQVIDGHKGIAVYQLRVRGHEAHSSLTHLGVSANHIAITLMNALMAIADDLKQNPPAGSNFIPPHATLTIGQMQGGTAANILAGEAHITFDIRTPPGCDAQAIIAPFYDICTAKHKEISSLYPECAVTLEQVANAPPMGPMAGEDAADFVRGLSGDNSPSGVVSYATEGGQFQAAGFPTLICGPGSIEQAHQPNEWIARDQLRRGAAFMLRLAEALK
jgi:acetylornithine deacetylase